MPIGLIAVCCRDDGPIRLTKSLFRLLTAIRLLSGGVARNLRRLRHAFEAHLVSDAAVSGTDQKQRRLFVIDRDQHAPSAECAGSRSSRGASDPADRSPTPCRLPHSPGIASGTVARNSLNVLEELTYERHCEP